MPGLFILLSLAAVAAMAVMGDASKTPSPSTPPNGPPPGSGDTFGPVGPHITSGKVTLPAGTKWILSLLLNQPTKDHAAFEAFYKNAAARDATFDSFSWEDSSGTPSDSRLLVSLWPKHDLTITVNDPLHELFAVESALQVGTRGAPVAPTTNTVSIPGTLVQIHAGETWVLAVEFAVSPGASLDKASFENGMRQEIGNDASITSMSWSGPVLQITLVYKSDDSFKIGSLGQVPTATVTMKSATKVGT